MHREGMGCLSAIATGRKITAMAALPETLERLNPIAIGVLSDTHGWMPPAVATVFAGVDVIVHAGDIDDPSVMVQLGRIAPVVGVRGNMDHGAWSQQLPTAALLTLGGKTFYVLHNLSGLDLLPEAAGIDVVICGHTHAPAMTRKNGVLYLNPGSASFPRHGSPAGGLRVNVNGDRITAQAVSFTDNGDRS